MALGLNHSKGDIGLVARTDNKEIRFATELHGHRLYAKVQIDLTSSRPIRIVIGRRLTQNRIHDKGMAVIDDDRIEKHNSRICHTSVINSPIDGNSEQSSEEESARHVRICLPAFDACHRIYPSIATRAELRRQVMKLQWWNPDERLVVDVLWMSLPRPDLYALQLGEEYGVNVIFYDYQSPDIEDYALWVLAVIPDNERMTDTRYAILEGLKVLVDERAPSLSLFI